MRIDKTLQQIRDLAFAPVSKEARQGAKVELVKSFYLISSPILKKEVAKKYLWILKIKPVIKEELELSGGIHIQTGKVKAFYSEELELKLDKIIVDVQRELQDEGKYMMPSKNDPRFGWGQQ